MLHDRDQALGLAGGPARGQIIGQSAMEMGAARGREPLVDALAKEVVPELVLTDAAWKLDQHLGQDRLVEGVEGAVVVVARDPGDRAQIEISSGDRRDAETRLGVRTQSLHLLPDQVVNALRQDRICKRVAATYQVGDEERVAVRAR